MFVRAQAAMTYHAMLGRIILFGGYPGGNAILSDTWTFESDKWKRLDNVTPNNLSGRYGSAMAYDAFHSKVVMFGGGTFDIKSSQTWLYSHEMPITDASASEHCLQADDKDQDGLVPQEDPDCYAYFRPQCLPFSSCDPRPGLAAVAPTALTMQQHCGDAVCDALRENFASCPSDCGLCGDFNCTGPQETASTCPGDCAM